MNSFSGRRPTARRQIRHASTSASASLIGLNSTNCKDTFCGQFKPARAASGIIHTGLHKAPRGQFIATPVTFDWLGWEPRMILRLG